ncbi:hypothetical protein [Polynucleobacter asymbioticus]|jgi:hypothetical protein|uniref:Uncharacterized protein n=1 Tax=Polynucleobacter asymbioticus TaxID=576611 RepID=A0AAC9IV43_9BURK|nr:hypothetical protein [Polynucleobacter asymbioticus]APB98958.1 hypothetical protein A4F89_06280 [Polynucleobacter asymbioticus]APC01260.1 hypothetical protein AOC25_06380 [Polynucleobacter asymbioticus]
MSEDKNSDTKFVIQPEQIQGRSIFIVETTPSGVQVKTGFLADDGRVLELPAIFPTQEYALSQIDELRKIVIQHFAQAQQAGALQGVSLEGPSPDDTIQ